MMNVFIFHGTEGYPGENWFPWMKKELEARGCRVVVPQFPSPPVVPAKMDEWRAVLKGFEKFIDENTIFIGHSLGGLFLLRVLEKLSHPIRGACFVGTPVGVLPVINYTRDTSFSGYDFDWEALKKKARHFIVYHFRTTTRMCRWGTARSSRKSWECGCHSSRRQGILTPRRDIRLLKH